MADKIPVVNKMFVLVYQGEDTGEVPNMPDAVSADPNVLKAYAVQMNGGEELNWIEVGNNRFVAYILVGYDEFNDEGESDHFYVIDEVNLV